MWSRRVAAISAVGFAGGVASLSSSASTPAPLRSLPLQKTVPLATTACAPCRPTCVLVHGLDSSKETFSATLAELTAAGYPAVAIDLRGHGESPLGDEAAFSPAALASDVLAAVHALNPPSGAVLVGHSMGGRVAMRAAALDAASPTTRVLHSVVIEDMDVKPRGQAYVKDLNERQTTALARFGTPDGRRFASWDAARAALLPWYGDERRVDGWKNVRIRQLPDGSWWSDINPKAQRLAAKHVLMSEDGQEAWGELAACAEGARCTLHVWYADEPGTVVSLDGCEGSIEAMKEVLPGAEYRIFPGSGHSIHNDKKHAKGFRAALRDVIDAAAREVVASSAQQQQQQSVKQVRGG